MALKIPSPLTPAPPAEQVPESGRPTVAARTYLTPEGWAHLESLLIPLGAIVISLLVFGIFCACLGANPLAVYGSIYRAAFGSWYAFQNTLLRAAPLMLCSLCTAIPFRLGLIVIGNEGALVVGGLCATLLGLQLPTAAPLAAQVAMAAAGMAAGGLWIAAVGALRQFRGVNETISSLLLNYVAIALLNQAINTWIRDPESINKASSFALTDEQMLPTLGGTNLHPGILFGLVACVLMWFLVQKTTFGFQIRAVGGNVRAARLAGLPVARITLVTCFLAGIWPGLAGMVEVAAVHGRANESLNAWYGNSGILVAFLARHNPLGCVLISILLGGLIESGGILQRSHHLPDATVLVFQGFVFLAILFSESLHGQGQWFGKFGWGRRGRRNG
ncbi:MAG TPA: ABC transporter permease [Chthoniobacterales bacterium]